MKRHVYLDYAAATPLDPRVLAAMMPYLTDRFANPSALYASGREERSVLDATRSRTAQVLGAKPTEIIFTTGATEGINIAIQGVLKHFPGGGFVTTAIEHSAVLAITASYQASRPTAIVPVGPSGVVGVEQVQNAVTDQTVLVSVMYANNEIGTIQPIAQIARVIAGIRADRTKRGVKLPLYLLTDASQAAGFLDLHVSRLEVDLMVLNSAKLYGPKQTGCLYVRSGVELDPVIYGGGQERGVRGGTENVSGVVGFATALELADEQRKAESTRLGYLRDQMIKFVQAEINGVTVNGDLKHRLPNNLNLSVDGVEGETLVLYLDQAGVMVATGSACVGAAREPSHVLKAIGCSQEAGVGSIRITLGRDATEEDIEFACKALKISIAQARNVYNS